MTTFSDTLLYPVKRKLSIYEKENVPTTKGRAFVMPGLPGTSSRDRTEVEELITRGYYGSDIIAIEKENTIALALYEHYHDDIQVHRGSAREHLQNTRNKFSYVHLDFCTELKEEETNTIFSTIGKLDAISRLRVTVCDTRRAGSNRGAGGYGKEVRLNVLLPFLEHCQTLDEQHRDRWNDIVENVVRSEDPIQLIGMVFLFAHFFGITFDDFYADCISARQNLFPSISPFMVIKNWSAWAYKEPTGSYNMASTWIDLYQIPDLLIADQQWKIDYVFNYVKDSISQIHSYNALLQAEGEYS